MEDGQSSYEQAPSDVQEIEVAERVVKVAKNSNKAIRWLRAAAAQGDEDAINGLRRLRVSL